MALLLDPGFSFDENSGLYKHLATGYLFDPATEQYLDTSSGLRYRYNYQTVNFEPLAGTALVDKKEAKKGPTNKKVTFFRAEEIYLLTGRVVM